MIRPAPSGRRARHPGVGSAQGALQAGPPAEPEGNVLGAAGPAAEASGPSGDPALDGPRARAAGDSRNAGAGTAAGAVAAGVGAGEAAKPVVKTGLGDEIDKAVGGSARLAEGLKALKDKGWKFEFGKDGAGSWCDKDGKKIVLDGRKSGNTADVLTTLAHELGHAQYKQEPYIDLDGLTRQQYVDRNTMRLLKDEGEAVLTNIEIKRQLAASGGERIYVAGAGASAYEKFYDEYLKDGDRDRARTQIATNFRDNEHPSTAPSKTYGEYYGESFAKYYDAAVKSP